MKILRIKIIPFGIILFIYAIISTSLLAQNNVDELCKIGDNYLAVGKYELAIENFNKALEIDPSNVIANTQLGKALAKSNKYERTFKKIVLEGEKSGIYSYLLGLDKYYQKNFDQAIDDFKEAERRGVATPELYCSLGLAYEANGDINSATIAYQRTIDLAPENNMANQRLGIVLAKSGKFDKEIKNLAKQGNNNAYYNYLAGMEYLKQGQADNAIAYFSKASELQPDSKEFQYALGLAYEGMGDFDKSMIAYNNVSGEGGLGFSRSQDENDTGIRARVMNRYKELAKTNAVDEQGRTALHIAVQKDDGELAKFLLENGANPNIQDKNGKTTLGYAKEEYLKTLLRRFGGE